MTRRGAAPVLAVAIAVGAVLAAPGAEAYPRPGYTMRVSVPTGGGETNGVSIAPAISADGRYVAFRSTGSNLTVGDTNTVADVFVHDRIAGTTERVSVASNGAEGNLASTAPAISADGRFVAFRSAASNLVADDSNDVWEVFVRDRVAGTTERVSVSSTGAEGNGRSDSPAISSNGRYVAFRSSASNLVAEDSNALSDVFIHDRVTRTTERVSESTSGAEGNGWSDSPAISADGAYIAFRSGSTNFTPGSPNVGAIYLRDMTARTTVRVAIGSGRPAISGDGRFVAFSSASPSLVSADSNRFADVFFWDRDTAHTERVSVSSYGAPADGLSADPAMSADGRFVAFRSDAANLTPDDANEVGDVFIHDRAARSTERVVSSAGIGPNGPSRDAALSADGRFVALRSDATNLDVDDTNEVADVFVRDRGALLGMVGPMTLQKVTGGVEVIGTAAVSGISISTATDPDDDGESVGPLTADDLGAEMIAASLAYRLEDEDLLVRVRLKSLPGRQGCLPFLVSNGEPVVCALTWMPLVVYGIQLEAGGTRFEARISKRPGTTCVPGFSIGGGPVCAASSGHEAALYRCDMDCTEEGPLPGAVGTTGNEVLISLPLVGVPAQPGAALTGMRVYTAVGDAFTGEVVSLDDVGLPDAVIPAVLAELGIAPASAPESQVSYTVTAPIVRGEFAGTVNSASLPPGAYRVWSRACQADVCGPGNWREVTL